MEPVQPVAAQSHLDGVLPAGASAISAPFQRSLRTSRTRHGCARLAITYTSLSGTPRFDRTSARALLRRLSLLLAGGALYPRNSQATVMGLSGTAPGQAHLTGSSR